MSVNGAPPPVDAAIMANFQAIFVRLREHPDKVIIDGLVNFAKTNVQQGYHITQAIISRFMDRRVPNTHKLPLLYVKDAVMKYVGGLFPHYFSRYAVDVVRRAEQDLAPGREQSKLDFLVQTWLERALMDPPALQGLQEFMTARKQRAAAAAAVQLPAPSEAAAHAVLQGFQPYLQTAPLAPTYGAHTTAQAPSALNREALVQQEMQALLEELLRGMGGASTTLDELSRSNHELYANIRQQGEMQTTTKYPHLAAAGPGMLAPPAAPRPPQPPQVAAPAAVPIVLEPYLSAWGSRHKPGAAESEAVSLGYIAETPVSISLVAAAQLCDRMDVDVAEETGEGAGGPVPAHVLAAAGGATGMRALRQQVRQRVLGLLAAVQTQPELPASLLGPLPLEPSKQYLVGAEAYGARHRKATEAAVRTSSLGLTRHKVPVPKFDVNALNLNKDFALRALYLERRYQFQDDGLRFRSQTELENYIDDSAQRKVKVNTIVAAGVMQSQQWYASVSDWCEEFESLLPGLDKSIDMALLACSSGDGGKKGHGSGTDKASSGSAAGEEAEDKWVYAVPADELFVRCPVSKNLFVQRWDDDEGEMLYNNAAKVFVTEGADANIFKLGQPVHAEYPQVRYLIVDKTMVLNPWLENGKASCVRDAAERYESMVQGREDGAESPYTEYLAALRDVAAEEDEEHTFTMLELN